MSEPRRPLLLASLSFLMLVVLVGVAADRGWPVIAELDRSSAGIREWAVQRPWLEDPLQVVETVFGTVAMSMATLAIAGYLLLRQHVRASALVMLVMMATTPLTHYAKELFGRDRPAWQDPDFLLHSSAYPSGHTTSIVALGGLTILLAIAGIRRRAVRVLVIASVCFAVFLVGADRLLQGRHYPSDVLGGVLLGVGLVLLGLALLHREPATERGATPVGDAPRRSRELQLSRSA